MNISSWPIGKIMQLPDHLFGRRWPIDVNARASENGGVVDIAEEPLPEWCVIWEVIYTGASIATFTCCCELYLADQTAATIVLAAQHEKLLKIGYRSLFERRVIRVGGYGMTIKVPMRMPIHSMGRRILGSFNFALTEESQVNIITVVSSIPTEIPQWYSSGRA